MKPQIIVYCDSCKVFHEYFWSDSLWDEEQQTEYSGWYDSDGDPAPVDDRYEDTQDRMAYLAEVSETGNDYLGYFDVKQKTSRQFTARVSGWDKQREKGIKLTAIRKNHGRTMPPSSFSQDVLDFLGAVRDGAIYVMDYFKNINQLRKVDDAQVSFPKGGKVARIKFTAEVSRPERAIKSEIKKLARAEYSKMSMK